MENRRRVHGELYSTLEECRARKRAKTSDEEPRAVEPMVTDGLPSNVGVQGLIKRRELVMLIEQALSNLGFSEVSEQLAEESGIKHETSAVTSFRTAILEGDFHQAVTLLDKIGLKDARILSQCKFVILEQRFLEDLERGDSKAALRCLQQDLGSIKVFGEERLHQLAGCILCTSAQALQDQLSWPGTADRRNRKQLLRDLQALMPPEIMIPEARLEELLEQALTQQISSAEFSGPSHQPVSLLADISHTRLRIPTQTVQVLTEHTEEVWHIQFSHNGRWLASASKDATAIVWAVCPPNPENGLVPRHILQGHTKELTFCCWRPDDSMLATCSLDGLVKVWDAETGKCTCTIDLHQGPAFTAAWHPDGEHLLTSGEDKRIYMSSIHNDGAPTRSWRCNGINELVALDCGLFALLPYAGDRIELWDTSGSPLDPEAAYPVIKEKECIVSFSISRSNSRLLLNMANRALHLWSLPSSDGAMKADMVQKFQGASERHSRFVVRSCFGGPNDCFVLSGSEECKVFVWHAVSGDLLAALEGHSGTVNSVSWNPVDHSMFASASDDKSIHIWGLDSALSECSSPSLSHSTDEAMSPSRKTQPWLSNGTSANREL